MSAARLPAGCPAPVATLPPRGSLQTVTFSMPGSVTFSMPIYSRDGILGRRAGGSGDMLGHMFSTPTWPLDRASTAVDCTRLFR